MGKVLAVLMVVVAAAGLAYFLTGASGKGSGSGGRGAIAETGGRLTFDAAGNAAFLDQFKGKVVVLDFWATWCGPCKAAMPGVQALHDRFQGRPVVVLGVNCMENGDAKGYMDQHGYTYGLVTHADDLAKKYGVRGIPTFVVLDFEGNTLLQRVGFSPENEEALASTVESYLASKGL